MGFYKKRQKSDVDLQGAVEIDGVAVTATAAELNKLDGVTKTAAQLEAILEDVVGTGFKVATGQHTTVAAADTVVTGLAAVAGVIVTLDDDPVDGAMFVSGSIGDQAGAPAAGSIYIKSWKNTDADSTLIAGTTFGKKVNWLAWGS